MDTNQNISDDQKRYGAIELKRAMPGNSAKGFSISISLFMLLFIGNFIFKYFINEIKVPDVMGRYSGKVEIRDYDFSKKQDPLPAKLSSKILITDIKEVIGKFVPIPDIDIVGELDQIATVDQMPFASSKPADEINNAGFNPAEIEFGGKDVVVKQTEEEYPDYYEFVPVEVYPQVDLRSLQKSVVYPELARKAGVEGKVYVRVLIDRYGKVVKSKIEFFDNQLLIEAAVKAVMGATFTPARQNGRSVSCWVTIPIVFVLH